MLICIFVIGVVDSISEILLNFKWDLSVLNITMWLD